MRTMEGAVFPVGILKVIFGPSAPTILGRVPKIRSKIVTVLRSEHFNSGKSFAAESFSRTKQTISARRTSQARDQTRVPRRCFTQGLSATNCTEVTCVCSSSSSRRVNISKKASSYPPPALRSEEHTSELQSHV